MRGRDGSARPLCAQGMNGLRKMALCHLLVAGVAFTAVGAEIIPNSNCLECHGDKDLNKTNAVGQVISLFIDPSKLSASVHKTNLCASCHSDLTRNHPDDDVAAKPVNCAVCHQKESDVYAASIHGMSRAMGASAAASCSDCHGKHDMMSARDPHSPVFKLNLPRTCARCHQNQSESYNASVHGLALLAGKTGAAICQDCHGSHEVLPPRRPPRHCTSRALPLLAVNVTPTPPGTCWRACTAKPPPGEFARRPPAPTATRNTGSKRSRAPRRTRWPNRSAASATRP